MEDSDKWVTGRFSGTFSIWAVASDAPTAGPNSEIVETERVSVFRCFCGESWQDFGDGMGNARNVEDGTIFRQSQNDGDDAAGACGGGGVGLGAGAAGADGGRAGV